MDNKEIRELAILMRETGLTKLEYESGGVAIRLERKPGVTRTIGTSALKSAETPAEFPAATASGGFVVKSPMVGVFYSAPAADKYPYVAIGDTVRVGDVLCIIEAMKIMNEITAERDGAIAEIYAENKQVVEFGQPLFRIET